MLLSAGRNGVNQTSWGRCRHRCFTCYVDNFKMLQVILFGGSFSGGLHTFRVSCPRGINRQLPLSQSLLCVLAPPREKEWKHGLRGAWGPHPPAQPLLAPQTALHGAPSWGC